MSKKEDMVSVLETIFGVQGPEVTTTPQYIHFLIREKTSVPGRQISVAIKFCEMNGYQFWNLDELGFHFRNDKE